MLIAARIRALRSSRMTNNAGFSVIRQSFGHVRASRHRNAPQEALANGVKYTLKRTVYVE